MPITYEPIATTTLGTASSTITFSSIPATYTDLRLVLVLKSAVDQYAQFRLNSDTGSNYSYTWMDGSGSAAAGGNGNNDSAVYLSQRTTPSGLNALFTLDFLSYAGNTLKTILTTNNQDNNGSGYVGIQVALWRSTSAINTINLISGVSIYDIGTTATLYGIKNAQYLHFDIQQCPYNFCCICYLLCYSQHLYGFSSKDQCQNRQSSNI